MNFLSIYNCPIRLALLNCEDLEKMSNVTIIVALSDFLRVVENESYMTCYY
jgi:hypothetical protein